MAAWTVANEYGVIASFDVEGGDLTFTTTRQVGVFWPLHGEAPFITNGIVRAESMDTPPWIMTGDAEYFAMMTVLKTGGRLIITDHRGVQHPCYVVGDIVTVLEDTPDSVSVPRRKITVPLLGTV